jgi:hypothetical protein
MLNFIVVIVGSIQHFNKTEFTKHIKGITINNQNEVEDKLLSLRKLYRYKQTDKL